MNEAPPVKLTPVNSSQIVAVGYDAAAAVLTILFKNRDGSAGSAHQYDRVPANVHAELIGGESVGSYFIRNIKKHPEHYPYRKISVESVVVEAPLYCPSLIVRDATDGQFWHPHLPAHEDENEEGDITPLVHAQGFEIVSVDGEDDEAFTGEELMEGGDRYWAAMRAWNPTSPAGDGWHLAAITDTENGPRAYFVRRKLSS